MVEILGLILLLGALAILMGAITTGTVRFICLGLVALFAIVSIRISTHKNVTNASSAASNQVPVVSSSPFPGPPSNSPTVISPVNPSSGFLAPPYRTPSPQNTPRLVDKLPPPFETFSLAEALSFFIVVLTLSVIFNSLEKGWKRTSSFGLLALFSVWLIAFLQETRTPQNQTLVNQIALAILELIFITIPQQTEKLPSPLNQPFSLVLAGLYIIILSILLSLTIKILVSIVGAIGSNLESQQIERIYRLEQQISELSEGKKEGNEEKNKTESKREEEDDERKQIKVLMRKSFFFLWQYYYINKGQTVKSFWLSVILIVLGAVIIGFTIYFSVTRPRSDLSVGVTIVSATAGIVLEFIGGSALVLYYKNLDSFDRFFKALTKDKDTMLAVELCENLKDLNHNTEYMQATKNVIDRLMSETPLKSPFDEDKAQEKLNDKSHDSKR